MESKRRKTGAGGKNLDTFGKRLLVLTLAILMTFQFSTASLSGVVFALSDQEAAEAQALEEAQQTEQAQAPEETKAIQNAPPEEPKVETPASKEEVKAEEPKAEEKEVKEETPAVVKEEVKTDETESKAEVKEETPDEPEEEQKEDTEVTEDTPVVSDVENTSEVVPEEEPAEEPVDEEEAEDDEVKLNADTMHFEKTINRVTVNVTALPGTFPEGTKMKVEAVNKAEVQDAVEKAMGGEVGDFRAVDITFYTDDETDIQPLKPVKVQMATTAFKSDEDLAVVHVEDPDKNKAEVMDLDTRKSDDTKAVFTADGFSVYVVIETLVPRLTLTFINGETPSPTMIIKDADTPDEVEDIIYDPGVTGLDSNEVFRGWTTEQNYTKDTDLLSIAEVRSAAISTADTITRDTSVTYYPAIFKQFKINYIDEAGISQGADTVEIPRYDTQGTYTVNMGYTPASSEQNFEGWLVAEGKSNIIGYEEGHLYKNEDVITVKGDVTFSVYEPTGRWLIFDENGKGATYNAPQFIKQGEVTSKPCDDSDMTRFGYTFGGWYKDAACTDGNEFSFGSELTEATTIYAKWNAATNARYTVIIWKENLAGDGWDFEESIPLTGRVGTAINTVTQQGSGNSAYARVNGSNKQYTGFHLKEFDQNVTINTEGTAIVNVYYERTSYTLTFRVNNSTVRTITGKYGTSVSNYFPIKNQNNESIVYDSYVWDPSPKNTFNQILVIIDTMPAENITFTGTNRGEGTSYATSNDYHNFRLQYYIQPTNLSTNHDNYELYNEVTAVYKIVTKAEDFIEISGFDQEISVPAFSGNEIHYNSSAEEYVYTVSTGDNDNSPEKYGDVGGQKARVYWRNGAFRTSNNNYATVYNGTVYTRSSVMTVKFYYTRSVYSINYKDGAYVDGNNNPMDEPSLGSLGTESNIAYGSDISSHASYRPETTPAGYAFEGWYSDKDCTHPYSFTTMPKGDITVYAKWRQIQYRVFLHPNAGTQQSDPSLTWGSDSQDMNFRVSYGGTVSTPTGLRDGYEFVGWYTDPALTKVFGKATRLTDSNTVPYNKETDFTDTMDAWGNGATTNSDATGYNGGDRFWITKKYELYAKWRSVLVGADGINVIYDVNTAEGGKAGTAPTDNTFYAEAASVTAGAASQPNDPTQKKFKHWVVQHWNGSDYVDTETTLLPGETFRIHQIDAKKLEREGSTPENPLYTYTVQLKAVYEDVEEKTPTHIAWYSNYGGDNDGKGTLYRYDKKDDQGNDTLGINEAVDVLGSQTREGYIFKGWTKTQGGTSADFLTWDGEKYTATVNGQTVTAVQVAADEKLPYEDLFAVWQPKLQVKVTGNTDTKVYNGSEQSVTGYTVEYKVGDGDWTSTVPAGVTVSLANGAVAEAKGTNVGNYPMSLTEDSFTVSAGDYAYDAATDLAVIDGNLEITEAYITINVTGHTDSKAYNGAEQSVTGYDLSSTDALYDASKVVLTGEAVAKGTNVGTYPMGLEESQFSYSDPNVNATFVVTDGSLEITKKAIAVTVTGHTDSKEYNGSEQKVEGYDLDCEDSLYDASKVVFTGEAVAKGTNVGPYPMGLNKDQFSYNDANLDVTFVVTDGSLEITKKAITVTVTGHTDSKEYNGSEQKVEGYDLGCEDSLYDASKVVFTGEAVAKGTNVGTYYMGLAKEQFSYNDANLDVTFSITDGQLVITKADLVVKITGHTDSKTYSGEEQKVEGYDVDIPAGADFTEDDIVFTGVAVAKGTDVDTYPMGLTTEQFSVPSTNYTVEFQVVDGSLEITKKAITVTVTGHTDSKTYNGNEQKVEGYDLSCTDTLYDASKVAFTGEAVAKGTNVDTYNMGLAKEQFSYNDANLDVTFAVTDGQLVITPVTDEYVITVTGNSDSQVYTGSEQSVSGYNVSEYDSTITFTGIAQDDEKATAKGTNVGTYTMTMTKDDFSAISDNYTNIKINVIPGTLEITPITDEVTVTIVGNNDSKVYTGSAQSVEGYTYSAKAGETTVANNEFTVALKEGKSARAEGTDVDTYYMGLTKDDFTVTSQNYSNITVVYTDGYIEITPITDAVTVTIVGNNDTKVYTGSAQSVEGYTYSAAAGETTIANAEFTVALKEGKEAKASGTDVDTYYMGLTKDDFTVTSQNYSNITVVYTDGYIEITPITEEVTVTIVGNNDSKVYTGSAQSVEGYTYSAKAGNTTVANDEFTVALKEGKEAKASGTNVGTYNMELTKDDFTVTSQNYSNVVVVYTDGYIEITPITDEVTVTIVGNNDSKVYTGSAQSVEGYTYSAKAGETIVANNEFTVALKEGKEAKATGTNVGTYNMELSKDDFSITSQNYSNIKVEYTDGYIEITPITDEVTVTIVGNNDTKVYTGSEQSVEGYTYSAKAGDATVANSEFTVALKEGKEAKASGTDVDTYYMDLTKDDFTVTSQNYSNIKVVYTDGYLEITPITGDVVVTIVGNNDSKVYTGSPQSVEGYTYTAVLPPAEEGGEPTTVANSEFTVAMKEGKEAKASGTDVNTYYMGLTENDFTVTSQNYSNITVVYTDGYIEITPITDAVTVTIVGNNDSKVYTGSTQSVEGYTYSAKAGETTVANSEFIVALKEGKAARAEGTNVGTYNMGLTKDDFTVTSQNYSNITVVYTDGYIEITPITDAVTVTIVGNNTSKVYTGSAQSVEGFTYSAKAGEAAVANSEFTVALKEGKEAKASGTNVGTYNMELTKDDFTVTSQNYSNITVVYTDGYIEITPITDEVTVTIVGNNDSKVYTGSAQSIEGYTYSAKAGETAIANAEFTVTLKEGKEAKAEGINVGTYNMELTKDDFTVTSQNYSNIKVEYTDGYIEITPITDEVTVTIVGNNDSKVYTGSAQSVEGYTYSAKAGDATVANSEFTVALKEGKEAKATGTNVGTYNMELTKEDFTVTSQNYEHVVVVYTDGYLEITPITDEVTVTIVGNNDSKVYTGSAQSVEGYTYSAKAGETSVANAEFTVALKEGKAARAEGTNVGTYNMELTKDDFTVTSQNYSNIKVEYTDGYIEITPITDEVTVTIVGNNDSKVYTGSVQSVEGYTYSAKAGETTVANSEFTVALKEGKEAKASGTNVGTYNMELTKDDFTVTSQNYSNVKVEYIDGYIEITPITDEVTVTIVGNNTSKVYTGSAQSVEGFTYSAKAGEAAVANSEFTVALKEGKEAKAEGTNVGTYNMGLTKDDFNVTSQNYSNVKVEYTDGYIEITPITGDVVVTIVGNHESKVYTGSAQSVTGYTYSAMLPPAEEGGEPTTVANSEFTVALKEGKAARAEGTNVGTYNMGLTKDDFTVTSQNYENIQVVYEDGYLEITPITDEVTVTIIGNHDSKVYTGSAQSVEGYTYSAKAGETTVASSEFTVALKEGKAARAEGTNVGTYNMELTKDDFTVTSQNYSNIKVEYTDGYIEITPITDEVTVTIVGNNDSKVYTGSAQSVEGYTYSAKAGETTVANSEFTVALKDGKEAKAEGTNVGTYNMELTKDDFTVTSQNYSNIKVVYTDGYIEITPITDEVTVTIVGNHDSKVYTGSAQSVEGYTYSAKAGEAAVANSEFTVALKEGKEARAEGTNVGTYNMGLTKDDFTVTSQNYSNVKVEYTDGYLEITPITGEVTVTIVGNNDSKVYTGSEQTVTGYTYSAANGNTSIANSEFTVTLKEGKEAKASGTNVGTYNMGLTKDDFTVTSQNYSNIKVEYTDGYIEITPITDEVTVTIVGNNDSKVYTGSVQSVEGYTYSAKAGNTTVANSEFTVALKEGKEAKAEGTNVGTYNMELAKVDFTVTSQNYSNIKVEYTDGYIEITPITDEYEITVTGNSDSKVYNANEQSVNGYTVSAYDPTITFTGIAQDDAKATAKGTNVGTYTMTMTKDDFSATSQNYTNIKITVAPGTLEITPNTDEYVITVTGNSDSKVYNAKEQSINGYTVSAYDPTITFTGIAQDDAKATAKGTNVGTYTMTMTKDDFGATSQNYTNIKITVAPGTLEITPATTEYEITVTGNSDSVDYNGVEQSVNGYTVSTYDSTITFTGIAQDDAKATAKGTNVGPYTMTMTKDDFSATSPNYTNIKITVVPGTLNINPKAVTIRANDANKPYDAAPLTQPEFTVSGLAETDTHKFTVVMTDDSTITDVGTQSNVIATVDGVKVTTGTATAVGNYTVTTANGTLTITADDSELVITSATNSWTYNGQNHKDETYTVTYKGEPVQADSTGKVFNLPNKDILTITATASGVTNVSDNASNNNTYTYVIKRGESETTGNYENIVANKGTLTINPKAVTITAEDADQIYNGAALTESGFTATDLEEGDEHEFTVTMTAASTITDVGTKGNVIATVDGVEVTTGTATAVGNYTVTTVDGTLEVTKRTITVTTGSGEKEYDGTALEGSTTKVAGTESAYKVDNLVGEETLDVTVTGTITNAGTAENTYRIDWTKGTAKEGNYTVTDSLGTLKITKANIPDDPDDPEDPQGNRFQATVPKDVVYNGLEQKQPVTVTDTKTAKDITEFFNITYSSDVTNVGTVTVTLTAKPDTDTFTNNYTGTVTRTYKITPAAAKVTAQAASKVYGAKDPAFTAEVTGMVNNEPISLISYTVTRPGAGTDEAAGTYKDAIVAAGNASQDNYTVTFVNADFEITKASIPENPDDPDNPQGNRFQATVPEDVVYNGTEQKQPVTVTDTLTGQTLGESDIEITYEGDTTNVGTVTVVITAKETGNYTGSFTRTYQILPADLTITADDKTKVYGANDPELTATLTGLVEGDSIEYSLARDAGEDVGSYVIHVTIPAQETKRGFFARLLAAAPANRNYNIKVVDGTFRITPAPVTITTGSATKVFDGIALTEGTATITGLQRGDSVTLRASGAQTAVGSSTNTYSIVWDNAKESNYTVTESLGTLTVTAPAPTPTPTPGGPTVTPVTPANIVPTPAEPEVEPEPIVPEPTPTVDPEPIEPEPTPEVAPGAWALINLLCTIGSALTSIITLILYFTGKKKDDDDAPEPQPTAAEGGNDEEDEEKDLKRKGLLRILSLIPGIGSVIVFFLTEDMSQPMVMVDKWTILMAILLVVTIVMAVLSKKTKKDDDKEEENTQVQA